MGKLTTHVLDTARGCPAAGVPVVLERASEPDSWTPIASVRTDTDGRASALKGELPLLPGRYRLVFDTATYFEAIGVRGFYPLVVVVFEAAAGESHYHVPLLLSPFGYATYRGS